MFAGRAIIAAALAIRLPYALTLVIGLAAIALISWGCWLLSQRSNYLLRGVCIVFVVALLGATVFNFIQASIP
jgi:UDP-N-acetylmuramyl pentapeptide phosphotransferase/UDP-N-acetylglucosamine-1-phosphate transferase